MGEVSEANPFGDLLSMLRKQFAKIKRELAAGDSCQVLARIDAMDAMAEVMQGDQWEVDRRDQQFIEELRNESKNVKSLMRCLEDGESVESGDEVYDTLEQDWRPVPGDLVGTVFSAADQHPIRRKIVAAVEG